MMLEPRNKAAKTTATPIAAMVETMLAAGAAHEAIVRAVKAAETQARVPPHRGTRLSPDWGPSALAVAYATERGLAEEQVSHEAEKFRNYWTAKTGAGATKRDWEATWRNWILGAMERCNGRPHNHMRRRFGADSAAGRAPAGADAVLAGMGRLARRFAEKRSTTGPDDGQVARGANATAELSLVPRRT
jgi:hypothetical protein